MITPLLIAALALQVAPPAKTHALVPATPADWRSERLEFPLGFAPDIALEGVEELRFAPGMFERGSETHWTYLFGLDVAAKSGSVLDVDQAFLEDFFVRYFRGLCGAVASSSGLALDLEAVRARVTGGGAAFTATVELFDAFGDGAPLALVLDVLVHPKQAGVELLALAAPAAASEAVRGELTTLGQAWRAERTVPVFLNHVLLTPDLATYEALAVSELLRELAVVEERTTRRGDAEYTSLYLYGEHTYLQFVKPDPAAGLLPGSSGVAFCVELPDGLARVAATFAETDVETFRADITRELDGVQLPWFELLGFKVTTAEQRLQLFTMEYDPQFLQRWHPPASPEPARIDRAALLARAVAVLGGSTDAPFGDLSNVQLTLTAPEHERYLQVARGLGLDLADMPAGYHAHNDIQVKRGVRFMMSADAERHAPGGVAFAVVDLRRPMAEKEVDFGQVVLWIDGHVARFLFVDALPADHGAPPRKLRLPELVRGIAFTPDGQELVASSFDEAVHVFDVASGAELRTFVPADDVGPLAISAEGAVLVGGGVGYSSNDPVRVLDLASGAELRELLGHTGHLEALRFSPDGTTLASAANDGTIRLWDTTSWEPLRTIVCSRGGSELGHALLRGIAFSPDGQRIAGFGADASGEGQWDTPLARVFDVASGSLIVELTGHTGIVLRGEFSADGKTLFTASGDRSVRAWDLSSGKELRRIESSHALYGAGFSPDRQTIVVRDGPLRFYDSATFAAVGTLGDPAMHVDVSRFVFSSDGKRLATDGDEGDIDLWDLSAR